MEIVQNYKDWYLVFFNRLFGIRIKKVHLRNGVVLVGSPKSLILDLVYEIFIQKVYNPWFMQIKSGGAVMDIGTNIGVFSLFAVKQGAGMVYCVEPNSRNITLIKRNFEINKLKNPNIINVAVSNKNGYGKLYLGDFDSHGSLFKRNFKQKQPKYIKVKTATLGKIFNICRIDKLDFLKIDCEGSEGEIVRSTKKNIWKKVKKIAIEYHDNASILTHRQIVEKLTKNGFTTKIKKTGKLFGYIYAWRN